MDIAHSTTSQVASVAFSFLSTEDVHAMSVQKIDNPILLDNVNLPTPGGLYDPKLGPMTSKDICETCGLSYFTCPGHYGHIELAVPLYHPLFMPQLFVLFRGICLFCHHFRMPEMLVRQQAARIRLLDAGLVEAAHHVSSFSPEGAQGAVAEGDETAQAEIPAETAAEFVHRIEQYTTLVLGVAKRRGMETRGNYKDGLVYEERKKALSEFTKMAQAWKRCTRCHAHQYTFRREKSIKIIEYDLDPKKKLANATMGLKRIDVLANGVMSKRAQKELNMEMDEGVEMSSASEDSAEEGEEGEDEDEGENRVARTASGQVKGARGRNERVVSAAEVRAHVRLLFVKEAGVIQVLYGRHGQPSGNTPLALADMFFLDVIPVSPTRFRPASKMGDELFENSQNTLLTAIIQTGRRIQDLNAQLHEYTGKTAEAEEEAAIQGQATRTFAMLLEAMIRLQHDVNSYMDSSKNPAVMRQGKLPPQGVKQVLEKKEGLFRKHMMGKRVNYAARSVISPDINIETNEIGVPPVFAKKLTYPEPVTQLNVAELRQLVINGPKVHPGAAIVQNEDGSQISLDRMTLEQRTAIANQLLTPQTEYSGGSRNKKVYRHLRDGDIVILNRQPTLHKPSMMCHKVKVLHGEKTIRMHYANCNSYNADFDGDEMNIHFPQNENARSEAYNIANTDNQYLVPMDGSPLRGLIQDHIVAGIWLCRKETFFTRDEYFQIIYGALRTEENYTGGGRIKTLPPTIWKPRALWTGKQLFSTILLNITPPHAKGLNLTSRNKILSSHWGGDSSKEDPAMSEETTVFLDGHLIIGVLDKSQYGPSAFGLIHSVHELYGPAIANRLLGILSRMLTKYLQHNAFTCRMDDLLLTAEGEKRRRQILDEATSRGDEIAIKFVGLEGSRDDVAKNLAIRLEETLRSDALMAGLDKAYGATFGEVTTKLNKEILPKRLMKPFPDNNMQRMVLSGAKGSQTNASLISTLVGQQNLEGRRVPTMVSGKTLPAFRAFDTSPRAGGYVANRFLTGIRPQEYYFHCMSGREGLIDTAVKTSRSGYLQRCLIKHLEGFRVHYDHTVRDSDASVLQFLYGEDSLDVTKSKHLRDFAFTARNVDSLISKYRPNEVIGKVVEDEGVEHMKKALKKPHKYPPALSVFSPSRYLGSMSEAYAKELNQFVDDNKLGFIAGKTSAYVAEKHRVPKRSFQQLSRVKYMRSVVDPGEAVGLLASQSVGEPSTQMTLNTFHLAGHGAGNVTLGIPRLREIVMTAARFPQTPTMQLWPREHVSDKVTDDFIKEVSRLNVSEVVDKVTVTELLTRETDVRTRKYSVHLQFYPRDEYTKEYNITPHMVHEALAYSFALNLKKEIVKELSVAFKTIQQDQSVGQGLRLRGEGGDEDEEPRRQGRDEDLERDDGDAGQEKRERQARQLEYEEDEEVNNLQDLEDNVEALMDEDEEMDVDPKEKAVTDAAADKLLEIFKVASKYATSFSFDTVNGESAQFDLQFPAATPKLLLVDLIERCCRASVIHEVPGIGQCARGFDDKGKYEGYLITAGSNLRGMWAMADEHIDLDKLGSNDIYAILTTYGVEAARRAIIDQMNSVFGVYGIRIDYRHLSIIADYMTHAGGYRPFNRSGISQKSSPFLKASFETTVAFLAEATLHGDFDDLNSPAGRIVMGRPGTNGTGAFDVRAPTRL